MSEKLPIEKSTLARLTEKAARLILKGFESAPKKEDEEEETAGGGEAVKGSAGTEQVPDAPPSPDALPTDTRMAGASPTKADLDEAADTAAAGAAASAPEPGAGDGDGDEDGAAAAGDGDGDEGGFDAHGNQDLDPDEARAVTKAFGNGTGQMEPKEALDGGLALDEFLALLLQKIEDQDAVISEFRQELEHLKSGQTATDRKISKALRSITPDPASTEPMPAPAAPEAPKPKATTVLKSFPSAPSAPVVSDPSAQVYLDVKNGRMTPEQALSLARERRLGAVS